MLKEQLVTAALIFFSNFHMNTLKIYDHVYNKLNERKTVHIQFFDDEEAEEFKSEMKNRLQYPVAKSRYEVVGGTGKTGKAVYIENKSKGKSKEDARALSKKDICLDLSDIIRDIMEGFDNSTSNIHLYKGVKVDYWGTKVAWISGGLNGSGEWSDYLNDLADFVIELEDRLHTSYAKDSRVNVVDVITDPADDVFDVLISITVGESFDETESLEWLEENYADSLDDVKFEWDKEVADWVFYDHAHLKLS